MNVKTVEREIDGITHIIELHTSTKPESNKFDFEGEKYAVIVKRPKPPSSPTYRYESFTKEILHPKRGAPIYIDYEILSFTEKLTATEITDLEQTLKKTLRLLGDVE